MIYMGLLFRERKNAQSLNLRLAASPRRASLATRHARRETRVSRVSQPDAQQEAARSRDRYAIMQASQQPLSRSVLTLRASRAQSSELRAQLSDS